MKTKNRQSILTISLLILILTTALNAKITKYDYELQDGAKLKIEDGNTSKFVNIQAPSGLASDVNFTLPAISGAVNQVLQTDGNGNTSWIDANSTIPDDSLDFD